jgi:hypothetical protein
LGAGAITGDSWGGLGGGAFMGWSGSGAGAHNVVTDAAPTQLAQVEPPVEEPFEEEPGETDPARMSDEGIERAEFDPDPTVRWRGYNAAKAKLAQIDPTAPEAGPELRAPGSVPTAKEFENVKQAIADARTAKLLGMTPEAYRELARDPAHGNQVTDTSRQERDAAIAAWKEGLIKGPPTRSTNPRADFDDADGQPWDVKSFNSQFPKGFRQGCSTL